MIGAVAENLGIVQVLAERHDAAPFPDCRGEEIDGVDLVLVDADLHGCVVHFLGRPFGNDQWQRDILRRVTEDLDRIVPQLPTEWSGYFVEARELAHAVLEAVGPAAP